MKLGKIFVIILASLLMLGFLYLAFPSLHHDAFPVAGTGISWGVMVGGLVFYTFYRWTSK